MARHVVVSIDSAEQNSHPEEWTISFSGDVGIEKPDADVALINFIHNMSFVKEHINYIYWRDRRWHVANIYQENLGTSPEGKLFVGFRARLVMPTKV
jgi:hypothetical protein